MLNTRSLGTLCLVGSSLALSSLLCLAGCGKEDPPASDDSMDLAIHPPDLTTGPMVDMTSGGTDMATKPVDMTSPPTDMATSGPKVMGLPSCTDKNVLADAVFTSVGKTYCANGRCHSSGAGGVTFTDGASMKTSMVGKKSGQATTLDMVKAGNVDQSYLIYKLMDQHLAAGVGGRGELMPKGGSKLPNADLCKFVVWVQEGAK
jgi:hypothetical protein